MSKDAIREFQVRCFKEYKSCIGLPDNYNYLYGNPVNVLVPVETATNCVMVIGAYPSAKFYTIGKVADVPLYDNPEPHSNRHAALQNPSPCLQQAYSLNIHQISSFLSLLTP